MDAKEVIARRVAEEVKPDMLVNLGIGLPSLVANYLPKDVHVFFQAENGVIGLGPRPPEGMEAPDLTDAGGGFVTAMPGAHQTLFNGQDGDRLAAHLAQHLAALGAA